MCRAECGDKNHKNRLNKWLRVFVDKVISAAMLFFWFIAGVDMKADRLAEALAD